jgi:hypothetical protein
VRRPVEWRLAEPLLNQLWGIAMTPTRPLAALRELVRERAPAERCDLCGQALVPEHQHLVEPASRRLLCCCDACAILFDRPDAARYRRVPRRVQALADFRLTDAQWEALNVPIGLAFFFRSTPAGRVVALYPSPAGATESAPGQEAWDDLAGDNPSLRDWEPDVEALLVNRVGQAREYYRVPIDECYRLVGLLRTRWRGLSGGTEVWEEIGRFFAGLRERAGRAGGGTHA